jgi:hypothetical protein
MAAPRSQVIDLPPGPPAPPRAVTVVVRRRSWIEPRVRFWWLAAAVIFGVAAYFSIDRVLDWMEVVHLVRSGTAVTATITRIGDESSGGRANISPDNEVYLHFTLQDSPYDVSGYLEGREKPISLQDQLQIRVDPADPSRWTYLTEPPPIWHQFLVVSLLLPIAAAALGVSLVLRRQMLRTWSEGKAQPYVVIDIGQTALAPLSLVVRCSALEGRDQRLVSVFIPRKAGQVRKGDPLWLVHPPGKPAAALAVLAYQ